MKLQGNMQIKSRIWPWDSIRTSRVSRSAGTITCICPPTKQSHAIKEVPWTKESKWQITLAPKETLRFTWLLGVLKLWPGRTRITPQAIAQPLDRGQNGIIRCMCYHARNVSVLKFDEWLELQFSFVLFGFQEIVITEVSSWARPE